LKIQFLCFINRKRYGLTVVGHITVEGFFALFSFGGVLAKILVKEGSDLKTFSKTIAKYIGKYDITNWLDENKFEILKR